MYFINEIPFTFDEMPDGHLYDQDLIKEADKNQSFEAEDLYRNSNYLIEEEAHPCFFMMDIENPQIYLMKHKYHMTKRICWDK